MNAGFPLLPDQASTAAGRMDALFLFLVGISAFFTLLIATLLVVFAIRYRRRSPEDRPAPTHGSWRLEVAWTLVPVAIVTIVFLWSADIFFTAHRVPEGALEVFVVGKRWMWKVQHMNGQREMNELHVPVGVPVKLTLTSEDVIHSFYVPAFRLKKDAVPGRYNTAWFQATRAGSYRLYCAEYCGTKHSKMLGTVTVMEPAAYQAWLSGGAAGASPVVAGGKLFRELACVTCHQAESEGRGPYLAGLFGKTVKLIDGRTVTADEAYIRESIVDPGAKVVAGFQPIMPTFQGLVSEEALLQLVAYVRSLKVEGESGAAPSASPTANALPAETERESR
jgi:cytochrome c oxidase subunit II